MRVHLGRLTAGCLLAGAVISASAASHSESNLGGPGVGIEEAAGAAFEFSADGNQAVPQSTAKAPAKPAGVLGAAAVGASLLTGLALFGFKFFGSAVAKCTEEDMGQKAAEHVLSLTPKYALEFPKGMLLIEATYPAGFSEAVKKLNAEEKKAFSDRIARKLQTELKEPSQVKEAITIELSAGDEDTAPKCTLNVTGKVTAAAAAAAAAAPSGIPPLPPTPPPPPPLPQSFAPQPKSADSKASS